MTPGLGIESTGTPFTTPIVLHLKVENGKIHYLHLYEDTLLISQAFGLAAGARAVGPTDPPQDINGGKRPTVAPK